MTKHLPPDARVGAADDPDAWVQEGLKAMREQYPSDESKRATLAHLGIGDLRTGNDAAPTKAPPRASAAGRTLLRWLLLGALLGVLALVLERWLG